MSSCASSIGCCLLVTAFQLAARFVLIISDRANSLPPLADPRRKAPREAAELTGLPGSTEVKASGLSGQRFRAIGVTGRSHCQREETLTGKLLRRDLRQRAAGG
jgi:hypothetical protein